MANVAHSTLAGADLHENKGAAAATDDFVATAASGATVWKKLTAVNLTGTGNPFGGQLSHFREVQASGVVSATQGIPVSTWTTLTLNTTSTNEISSASLASNVVSLPAGTYHFKAVTAMTYGSATHRTRLYNITDASVILTSLNGNGMQTNTGSPISGGYHMTIEGRFTIAGTKSVALQGYSSSGTFSSQNGTIATTSEVYTDLLIWKIA